VGAVVRSTSHLQAVEVDRRPDQLDAGRELRKSVPRSSWADWAPADDRQSSAIIEEQNTGRIQALVPLRRARMAESAFAFYRGGAAIMANDLLSAPTSGITVQACGDAHIGNFGLFASRERSLVFDVNDFDETLPGPFEWDVARLAASAFIAAQHNGLDQAYAGKVARATVRSYCQRMIGYASQPTLQVWYEQVGVDVAAGITRPKDRPAVEQAVAKARTRTSDRLLAKLTTTDDHGRLVITDQPPVISHLDPEQVGEELREVSVSYLESLTDDRRALVSRFQAVDFAMKVVGVGSVGTRCFVGLFLDDAGYPLFLQLKEASASVLQVHPGAPPVDHQGARVVKGQRLIQAAPDIFLGWSRAGTTDYYVRQLQDMKGSIDLATLKPAELLAYAGLCGWSLARAHARAGQAARIAGYLGSGRTFTRAISQFAQTYANVNRQDHERFRDRGSDLSHLFDAGRADGR
jgi:uncharacterized protein (DUF2252 family)